MNATIEVYEKEVEFSSGQVATVRCTRYPDGVPQKPVGELSPTRSFPTLSSSRGGGDPFTASSGPRYYGPGSSSGEYS